MAAQLGNVQRSVYDISGIRSKALEHRKCLTTMQICFETPGPVASDISIEQLEKVPITSIQAWTRGGLGVMAPDRLVAVG